MIVIGFHNLEISGFFFKNGLKILIKQIEQVEQMWTNDGSRTFF